MYHGVDSKKKINPREKANFLSRITFLFAWKLLQKGYKKEITEDDIYEVPRRFASSHLGDKLEKSWGKELKKQKPSMYSLLWNMYGKYYLTLGVIQLCMKLLIVLVQPRALGKLVSYFTATSQMSKMDAVYYATLLVGLNIFNCTYSHNYMFLITELGIRIKSAMCSLIYRKSLKLTASSLSQIGVGKIVTLVSKDVISIETAIIFMNDVWISFILLSLTTYLMFSKVGVAALAGVVFLLSIIPIQVFLGKLTSRLRIKGSKITDQRIQATQETISAIKIIKMYTWETFFSGTISKAREAEMKKIRQIYWTKATSLVIGSLIINLTLYIIVMTYTSLGNNFTAEISFFIWSCLMSLRSTITISIPIGIAQTAELIASLGRIEKVLTVKEPLQSVRNKTKAEKPFLEMQNVEVNIGNKEILHNINLRFDSGLNVLTGKLGGGKSSLLKTILEDYPITSGTLKVVGTISYASEEPWLFPSSIRQNILFGKKYDEERYRKVLKVCALELDVSTFEKGDETIVDDRGMNFSKGQQARFNLARAVYCDSDIYLLDDCLSSLDTHVQHFVFEECIKKFLKTKIVIMISQNEYQLKKANNIIFIENGTIKSCLNPTQATEEDLEELVRDNVNDNTIIDNIISSKEDFKEEDALLEKKPNQNIYRETKKTGKVAFSIYQKYISFGGGLKILAPLFLLFIVAQVISTLSEKVVSNWINIQQNISDYKFKSSTNSTDYEELLRKDSKISTIYSIAIITSTLLLLLRAYSHFGVAGKASVAIHKAMAVSVVTATMKFFDQHYTGNILNRFSKDLATIDEFLPLNLYECLSLICRLTGMLLLILTVNWTFIIPTAIIFTLLFFMRKWYLPAGRSLKRLDSATRSPMIGHINASLEGITTVRAYNTQDILRKEFDKHQDLYTSNHYMLQTASRGFAYFLDMLCNFFIIVVVFRFVIMKKDTLAGNVGLAITQALGLTGILQWGIRQWAELENQMTSVERVVEYTKVEKENKSGQLIEDWPLKGEIIYDDVNLTYGKSKELVLKNITFTVNPGEKIGIVGRTGAGKSSIISVLYRLYDYQGTIKIDNVDIRSLTLDCLRSRIAIIPQDPILFSGTIRSNLDPTSKYSDEAIWKAIETAHLKPLFSSLNDKISEAGSNFSSGQKQLICLARAIISKRKIIVLDEATANIDPETDVMIYSVIQESFKECSVLTIAHRLQNVLYSDKVMVVDKGIIVEYDEPNALLDNKNGIFYKMIHQSNLLA